jgi:hypothetical protein
MDGVWPPAGGAGGRAAGVAAPKGRLNFLFARSSSHPPNSVPLTPPSASSLGADALRDTGLFVTRYEFGLPVRNRKVQI